MTRESLYRTTPGQQSIIAAAAISERETYFAFNHLDPDGDRTTETIFTNAEGFVLADFTDPDSNVDFYICLDSTISEMDYDTRILFSAEMYISANDYPENGDEETYEIENLDSTDLIDWETAPEHLYQGQQLGIPFLFLDVSRLTVDQIREEYEQTLYSLFCRSSRQKIIRRLIDCLRDPEKKIKYPTICRTLGI